MSIWMGCDGNCESALRLRARLAAVEKERDEARSLHSAAVDLGVRVLENETAGLRQQLAAANERVKALEEALDPTAEGRREYVSALVGSGWYEETADAIMAMDELLHAIRSRVGLTKDGG